MNRCPVTGNVCNKPVSFIITEQLGDKAQSTSCCRDCASYHVQQRNTQAVSKELEQQGIQLVPVTNDFVTKVFGYATKASPQDVKSCQKCGCTFDQILAQNRIGCTHCYSTFREELKPYLDKSQGEDHKHVGKVPLAAKLAALPVDEQLEVLRSSMQVAIEQEDYEKAAKFRDMINKIKESSPPSN